MAEIVYPTVPTTPVAGSETQAFLSQTGRGALKADMVSSKYHALAEAGLIYTAQFGVVTNAVASVVDIPSTGGHFCLWNGATAGRGAVNYSILSVGWASASGTVGIGAFAVAGVSSGVQATVSTTSGNLIYSACGSTRPTSAKADSTLTITSQPAWGIIGNYNSVSGVGIGFGSVFYADGMFSVPPAFLFAVAVVSPTGSSPAFLCTITYAEIPSYQV